MNYLFTAAGRGSRFLNNGVKPPKPLIKVLGLELLLWSLTSFRFKEGDSIYIVSLREDNIKRRIGSKLSHLYPFCKIYWHERTTISQGQLVTALEAVEELGLKGPLVIHNCDTKYTAIDIDLYSCNSEVFGIVPCFHAEGSHWSFAETNSEGSIVKIKEKERISNNCSVGTYIFSDSRRFQELAREYISMYRESSDEIYIAPLYQHAIDQGERVIMIKAEGVYCFGTPQELKESFSVSDYDLIAENAWNAHQRRTIVVDVDGTLCQKPSGLDYFDCVPIQSMCDALRRAHLEGCYIILMTSRNVRTFNGNMGLINKYTARTLQAWLEKHEIPYDEIYYGKPWGQGGVGYIDDLNVGIKEFVAASQGNANEIQ